MIPGQTASREEFNLYNPAFVAVVLSEATKGFHEGTTDVAPLPLAFSASTIAMFTHLRADLPSSTRPHLAKWITDHTEFRPEFERLLLGSLTPLRAGLLFAMGHGVVQLEGSGLSARARRKRLPESISDETEAILTAARFTGRWFSTAGSTSTTLSLLGFGP